MCGRCYISHIGEVLLSISSAYHIHLLCKMHFKSCESHMIINQKGLRNEEFTAFRSVFIVKGMRKILPYALKMRQDYLSTRYLDQFISPSSRYAHSGDIFDPSN